MARTFLIMMDIDNVGMPNTPRGSGSLLVDLLGLLFGMSVVSNKVKNLSKKLDELVKAYYEDISDSDNVGYRINRSELLLLAHDAVQRIKTLPRKERLAIAVLSAPWDRFASSPGFNKKVMEIKSRAEGRSYLAK